ncbi:MAG: DUF2975 domain-containing protein [Actinobacteria bacterium]|nr:DUF2975 domain-containing protein [Actinomycetota bacterium]NBP12042.1 DUF2975 domain-containing protein [Actinomycetota bacterium]NCY10719.1 DUF2975 domain-containing protein [Actinomycetota bacterium]NDC81328.1 DUF2975 domain-containing protein [Actinomycetota bacterium]NDD51481.1 DUF2975 domain-containing protein [Actinomycetota bacterium]
MKTFRFLAARLALLLLFLMITVLQLFSFPGQFAHMRRVHGSALALEIVLTILVGCLFLAAQFALFSLWKLVSHMELETFFSPDAAPWLDKLVAALKFACIFPVALIFIVAPQADDPGALVLLTAVTLFVVTVYLLGSLLHDQVLQVIYRENHSK